jgi:hypothetical protein
VEPWECTPPPELEPWLPAFAWSPEKLGALLLSVIQLEVAELAWMLDLPVWPAEDGTEFQVRPLDVVAGPHLARTNDADLSVPLHVFRRDDRWVVLDGLHGVLKAARSGQVTLPARVLPDEALGQIAA